MSEKKENVLTSKLTQENARENVDVKRCLLNEIIITTQNVCLRAKRANC